MSEFFLHLVRHFYYSPGHSDPATSVMLGAASHGFQATLEMTLVSLGLLRDPFLFVATVYSVLLRRFGLGPPR
jgi:hypothetical protein